MLDVVRASAVYCLAIAVTVLAWRLTTLAATALLAVLVLSSVLLAWPVGRMTRRHGSRPMLRAATAILVGTVVGSLALLAFVRMAVPGGEWFVLLALMAQFVVCLPLAIVSAIAAARLSGPR